MRKLILMRGLPGSGKSSLAQLLASSHILAGNKSVAICSTDDYHMIDGKYVFNADMLGQFHELNHKEAEGYMKIGIELIIIDNTNIKLRDMRPYRNSAKQLGYTAEEVIVGKEELLSDLENADPHKFVNYIDMCAKRNTHGVPREAIEKMARRFQE